MQRFFEKLNRVYTLSQSEEKLIKEQLYIEELAPKQYILKAGEISRRIGFILDGVMRIFFYDQEGNEIIRCFHRKDHFFGAGGYMEQEASDDYIQAVTKSRVLFLNKSGDELLNERIGKWSVITRKIAEAVLFEKNKYTTELFHKGAEARYKWFVKEFGKESNLIPLKYVASFLGIKQQSLSRIRKSIKW